MYPRCRVVLVNRSKVMKCFFNLFKIRVVKILLKIIQDESLKE